jgi:hypothetical protein
VCLLIVVVIFDFLPLLSILIFIKYISFSLECRRKHSVSHATSPLPDNANKSLSTGRTSLPNEVRYVAS